MLCSEVRLGAPSLGDVAHERVEDPGVAGLEWRDRELDRELVTVAVKRLDLNPLSDDRALTGLEEAGKPAHVGLSVATRHYRLRQRTSNRLLGAQPECRLGRGVPTLDRAPLVHRYEG